LSLDLPTQRLSRAFAFGSDIATEAARAVVEMIGGILNAVCGARLQMLEEPVTSRLSVARSPRRAARSGLLSTNSLMMLGSPIAAIV
jgi:hypothetical protein